MLYQYKYKLTCPNGHKTERMMGNPVVYGELKLVKEIKCPICNEIVIDRPNEVIEVNNGG